MNSRVIGFIMVIYLSACFVNLKCFASTTYEQMYSTEFAEQDEEYELADCLNNAENVAEAFEICVEPVAFQYPAANELAACISKHRELTDDELSAYVIEECYE